MSLLPLIHNLAHDLLDRLTVGRSANLDEISGSRMAKLDAVETRLTAARAQYLDLIALLDQRLTAARATALDSLSAIAGDLDALEGRLTANRATRLDQLDAAISSRAPASTALENTTWTAGRAMKLDQVDAAISSRLGAIKAVYRGTITLSSGTSTASAALGGTVNLAKTLLFPLGSTVNVASYQNDAMALLSLNATSVTATRADNDGTMVIGYQVVEFN
jgi:hypothetical protein